MLGIALQNDYYPFGMPMPNRNIQDANAYRYAYQGQEKDPETGKEAFAERLWDNRIGRWLTPDPAGKGDTPYIGMYNNPLKYIDIKGRDTLNIYRSKLLRVKTPEYGYDYAVYKLNFEIIKNGKKLKQKLVLYMYANHQYEKVNNKNLKPVQPISFTVMNSHRGEKDHANDIQIQGGVFIHNGDPIWNIGCKAVTRDEDTPFGPGQMRKTMQSTLDGLQDIRDLYNTTDKQGFFFLTNFSLPRQTPINTPNPAGLAPLTPDMYKPE